VRKRTIFCIGTSPGLERHALVVDHDQGAVAIDHRPHRRQVERHDRDVLEVDVLPDVELGPVRQRKDADRFARVLARVVEPPELGPLRLRVPAVLGAAEREDALLGARLLLVAPGAAEGRVEAVQVERLLQALRLPHVGVELGAVGEGVDAEPGRLGVLVDQELHPASRTIRSRRAYIALNFQVVSTWSSGNGGGDGKNAFLARCSMQALSLPIE
jgi:hypothetical protein